MNLEESQKQKNVPDAQINDTKTQSKDDANQDKEGEGAQSGST